MDLELTGKRAVVIGASRGIGAAIARELADEGAQVLGVSRAPDGEYDWPMMAADLASPDAARSIADHAQKLMGGADILINNCGGPPPSTAQDTDAAALMSAVQPMLITITELTRALLPRMRESGFGRILTVTSAAVREPMAGLVLSNTLRSAVHAWMKTLAKEVAADGVTVNMLMPGQIATDRLREIHEGAAQRMGLPAQTVIAKAAEGIPMGRFGTPREFAALAAFLASPRASYLTGLEVPVDGGFLKS